MALKYLVQIAVAGSQVVARAFARALKQEYQASQQAAARAGGGRKGTKQAVADTSTGMSLQEAKNILNVSDVADAEEVSSKYEHLFAVNEKQKGGSFYIQSKVVRAKERIDMEVKQNTETKTEDSGKQQSSPDT